MNEEELEAALQLLWERMRHGEDVSLVSSHRANPRSRNDGWLTIVWRYHDGITIQPLKKGIVE